MSELMLAKDQKLKLTLRYPEDAPGNNKKMKIKKRENRGYLTIRADKIKKTEDIIRF